MASDVKKMLDYVFHRVGCELPETVEAESRMQDENGETMLRLCFGVHKDVIVKIGYEAHPEVPVDFAAAMACVTVLAKDKAIAAAALIRETDLAALLSDDGTVDEENQAAVQTAILMLRECLRNYSASYNQKRAARLAQRDAQEKEEIT